MSGCSIRAPSQEECQAVALLGGQRRGCGDVLFDVVGEALGSEIAPCLDEIGVVCAAGTGERANARLVVTDGGHEDILRMRVRGVVGPLTASYFPGDPGRSPPFRA